MRLNRIFCEGPLTRGATVLLPSAGAYHVARVLRMRPGAPLIVFDGSGIDHQAEIVEVDGDKVSVQLRGQTPGTDESPIKVTLRATHTTRMRSSACAGAGRVRAAAGTCRTTLISAPATPT